MGAAAKQIAEQVRPLRRQGVKFEVVAEILSDLNRRLFAKLFDLLCPDEMRDKTCLIVMGSEGRGEQTIRTDQDNGLILSEPVDEAALKRFRDEFSGALAEFRLSALSGPCDGRQSALVAHARRICRGFRRWTTTPDEQSSMNIAIFFDAEAVAGDSALLARPKRLWSRKSPTSACCLARFAKAIEAFEPPIGLFNTLKTSEGDGDALDLKKGGIFPIVHGVRSLAIEQGLEETNTFKRLAKLAELGLLKEEFARDLARALDYLMTFASTPRSTRRERSLLRPATLTSMDRDCCAIPSRW